MNRPTNHCNTKFNEKKLINNFSRPAIACYSLQRSAFLLSEYIFVKSAQNSLCGCREFISVASFISIENPGPCCDQQVYKKGSGVFKQKYRLPAYLRSQILDVNFCTIFQGHTGNSVSIFLIFSFSF